MASPYAPGQDFSPKAGYDDAALQGLPRANTRPAGYFDPNEFETIQNVPVFQEHETVAHNGRALRFGREELSAIVDRCNRRISESGDYATVTIGHTPSPEAKAAGAPDPEVVGFAGPYRLGIIGEPGQRQKYAILADCHYFRGDLDKVRKHPRRSPELFLEDRYSEMFFDPIALLGAEAPRLDMGLLYSAKLDGRRIVEKYAAASPAAGNVFVPSDSIRKDYNAGLDGDLPAPGNSMVSDDSLRHAYSAGQPSEDYAMISPEDVKIIVDAIEQLPWVQQIKSQTGGSPGAPGSGPMNGHAPAPGMPGQIPPAGGPPMGAAPPAPAPAAPPAAPHPLAAQPMPPAPAAPHPAPAAPAPAAAPPAAHPTPPAAPSAGPPATAGGPPKPSAPQASGSKPPDDNKPAGPSGEAKPDDKEPKKMQAQYSADGGNADPDYNADEDLEGEHIDHELGSAKAKYAACDDMFDDDDDFQKYSAYRASRKKNYEAGGSADGPDSPAPANASVEGNDGEPPKGDVADGQGEAATSYGGTGENIAVKYSRLAGTVEKYGRELAQVRGELDKERALRVDAEREAELVDLRMNGHVGLNPKKLMPKLCYSKIRDDKQYRETLDMILETSARVPMGGLPYVPDSEPLVANAPTGITREKFSKEHSDRAMQICEAAAVQGQEVDYVSVLRDVQAGKR